MAALGQKQTYAVQHGMSALLPKADMCGAASDVRFGSKADICAAKKECPLYPRRVVTSAVCAGGHGTEP